MIVIDGNNSGLSLATYANLEDALIQLTSSESFQGRIVTDVFVNDEAFSELYPHQAEDIAIDEISRLEVRSVTINEMSVDILNELPKVITLLSVNAKTTGSLFRQNKLSEAFELIQDIVSTGIDFIQTLSVIKDIFSSEDTEELGTISNSLSNLLNEINVGMEEEDWMLVSDLLEFEFAPATYAWTSIIDSIKNEIEGN